MVKHRQQRLQNRRTVNRLRAGRLSGTPRRRHYRDGFVFSTDLSRDSISEEDLAHSTFRLSLKEPFSIASHGDLTAITAGCKVLVLDTCARTASIISDDWFGQLHSAVFSQDGRRILIASSGFDTVGEWDTGTGQAAWRWCAWEHGYSDSLDGHLVVTDRLSAQRSLRDGRRVILVQSPADFRVDGLGHGLPTRLQVCHINGAVYAHDSRVLATLFHQGQVIAIDRERGRPDVLCDGLAHPHGISTDGNAGYMLADTSEGRVIFLDSGFRARKVIGLAGLPGIAPGRRHATEWLQHVSRLQDDIYVVVDTHRSALHLIAPGARSFRTIGVPRDWAVQMVAPLMAGLGSWDDMRVSGARRTVPGAFWAGSG